MSCTLCARKLVRSGRTLQLHRLQEILQHFIALAAQLFGGFGFFASRRFRVTRLFDQRPQQYRITGFSTKPHPSGRWSEGTDVLALDFCIFFRGFESSPERLPIGRKIPISRSAEGVWPSDESMVKSQSRRET